MKNSSLLKVCVRMHIHVYLSVNLWFFVEDFETLAGGKINQ